MEVEQDFTIRPAAEEDVPGINAILTHYALHTIMTFATTAQPDSAVASKLESITSSENRLPFLIATTRPCPSPDARDPKPKVIGISYISPYRPERLAYCHTGELSLFVHSEYHGQGIGSALLRAVVEVTRQTRIRELLAVMAVDENGKGRGLALRDWYKCWGFREVGILEKVGFKFDRWIDVITLQLHVGESR